MSKLLKRLMVHELVEQFKDVERLLLIDYRGVSAEESKELRRALKENGVQLRVIKNSAIRLAFRQVGLDEAVAYVEGPTAVLWGGKDVIALARAAWQSTRKYEAVSVRGGVAEGAILSADDVAALARFPSGQALLSEVVACFEAPARTLVSLFDAPTTQLVRLVDAIAQKS